jgi:preprotein translocase subunit SecG
LRVAQRISLITTPSISSEIVKTIVGGGIGRAGRGGGGGAVGGGGGTAASPTRRTTSVISIFFILLLFLVHILGAKITINSEFGIKNTILRKNNR